MEFSRPEYWSRQPFSSPGDLPNPGIGPRSPTLQADSLLTEPQGKPKNTGVDSLSLLQQIFLTQESNWGLLHCKWILYQLSNAKDKGTTPGLGYLLQYLCLGNPMGRGNWQATYSPWNSPGQNTVVGSLSLLQRIFPIQGSNPGLPHCRWILYQLSHKGSPRIQEWVAYPFSSRSSRPRNQTRVSCIAGGFFTS